MNLLEKATALGISGFLHCNELDKLAELAMNKDVLEVGSFTGLSAWGMAGTAKSLMCVDTFKADTDGQKQTKQLTTFDMFSKAIAGFSNVRYFIGTSEEAAEQISGDFDFIFLDATHTYDEVKADLLRWWPRVRPGGILAIHDYRHHSFPGVEEAADELFGPAPPDTTLITLRWVKKKMGLLGHVSLGERT